MYSGQGRDSKPLEQIGSYDPLVNAHNEKLVAINLERLKYWVAKGAQPTKLTGELLGLSGVLPIHPYTYLRARRRREEAEKQSALPSPLSSDPPVEELTKEAH